jgi:hypothetical protein
MNLLPPAPASAPSFRVASCLSFRMRSACVSPSQITTSGRQVDYGMISLGIGTAKLYVVVPAR